MNMMMRDGKPFTLDEYLRLGSDVLPDEPQLQRAKRLEPTTRASRWPTREEWPDVIIRIVLIVALAVLIGMIAGCATTQTPAPESAQQITARRQQAMFVARDQIETRHWHVASPGEFARAAVWYMSDPTTTEAEGLRQPGWDMADTTACRTITFGGYDPQPPVTICTPPGVTLPWIIGATRVILCDLMPGDLYLAKSDTTGFEIRRVNLVRMGTE